MFKIGDYVRINTSDIKNKIVGGPRYVGGVEKYLCEAKNSERVWRGVSKLSKVEPKYKIGTKIQLRMWAGNPSPESVAIIEGFSAENERYFVKTKSGGAISLTEKDIDDFCAVIEPAAYDGTFRRVAINPLAGMAKIQPKYPNGTEIPAQYHSDGSELMGKSVIREYNEKLDLYVVAPEYGMSHFMPEKMIDELLTVEFPVGTKVLAKSSIYFVGAESGKRLITRSQSYVIEGYKGSRPYVRNDLGNMHSFSMRKFESLFEKEKLFAADEVSGPTTEKMYLLRRFKDLAIGAPYLIDKIGANRYNIKPHRRASIEATIPDLGDFFSTKRPLFFSEGDTVFHENYGAGTVTQYGVGVLKMGMLVDFKGETHKFFLNGSDGKGSYLSNNVLSQKQFNRFDGGFTLEPIGFEGEEIKPFVPARGDRVKSKKYGLGTITCLIEGKLLYVVFDQSDPESRTVYTYEGRFVGSDDRDLEFLS